MFWTCLETVMTVDTILHPGKNYKCTRIWNSLALFKNQNFISMPTWFRIDMLSTPNGFADKAKAWQNMLLLRTTTKLRSYCKNAWSLRNFFADEAKAWERWGRGTVPAGRESGARRGRGGQGERCFFYKKGEIKVKYFVYFVKRE